MHTIRAIFFDAVGTLLHPEPAAPLVYAEVGRRFGSRYSPEIIAQRFGRAFQIQEEIDRKNDWLTSEPRERQRWRAIVGDVLDDSADPSGCFEVLYRHFAKPESWRCDPGAQALFEVLLVRGCQLGLASNFDFRLFHLVNGLTALHPLCRHIVASFEVGFRKPARAFFQTMYRRMGLAPEEILHVGDDPANDYAGARAAGLAAVLFDPEGKFEHWEGARIRILGEVREILDEG